MKPELRIQFLPAAETADFRLLVSLAKPNGENIATITSMSPDDPGLVERLKDIHQTFRMTMRFAEGGENG